MSGFVFDEITTSTPEKSLLAPIKKKGGRNNMGRITVRHRGGGHKRRYRIIDFKRDKMGVPGKVATIEYDPNRSARIALIHFVDGEKRYILHALNLQVGDEIVTSDGLPVTSFAGVTIPSTATNVSISPDGTVSLTDQGVTSTVGQITLSRFANPAGMESLGSSLYRATLASGTEETGTPGLAGMGQVQQGWLELSNVKVIEEMVNLIKAQRAYEINSKSIQAADEMMSMSNRLRG